MADPKRFMNAPGKTSTFSGQREALVKVWQCNQHAFRFATQNISQAGAAELPDTNPDRGTNRGWRNLLLEGLLFGLRAEKGKLGSQSKSLF